MKKNKVKLTKEQKLQKKIEKKNARFSPEEYQKNLKICIISYLVASVIGCLVGKFFFVGILAVIGFLTYCVIKKAPLVEDEMSSLPPESQFALRYLSEEFKFYNENPKVKKIVDDIIKEGKKKYQNQKEE